MSDLQTCTRRMLVALDHYWAAYEEDVDRMGLWWNAFEREREKVEALLRRPAALAAVQASAEPPEQKPVHRMSEHELRASVNRFTEDDPPPYGKERVE